MEAPVPVPMSPEHLYLAEKSLYQEKCAKLLERYQSDWQGGHMHRWRTERNKLVATAPTEP